MIFYWCGSLECTPVFNITGYLTNYDEDIFIYGWHLYSMKDRMDKYILVSY